MTNSPRIAFCTTCKGRTQHLRLTLPKNLADNSNYENAVFVVLDYNSPDNLKEYIQANHAADLASGRLVVYSYPDAGKFHMAHAKNMAHRCGILEGGNILVNLDADGFTGEGFAEYLAQEFTQHDILMQAMWNRWVEKNGVKEWMAQDSQGRFGPPVPKGSNGRMAVTTKGFLKAGGYDEKYAAWGPDDKDFNIRLRRLGYKPVLIERRFLDTILHNDKVRFRDYPHAATHKADEFQITVHDSTETIANFGHFGEGVVYRNFKFNPITLGPVPTRIFGIGMHKTATTSLSHALKTLGIDSAHWISAHWAKAIWREMNTDGRSLTLEKHYALSDLPIPMLFRQLDKAYPGSKFILTTRDEQKWIRSVERHWDPTINPFRDQWDSDPWSNRAHQIIYGQTTFDHDLFLARYRRHNREVLEYFKNRAHDLLVMSMDGDAGWDELCGFLGRPIPTVPYPQKFRSEVEGVKPEIPAKKSGWWRDWWPWVAAAILCFAIIAFHLLK